MSWETFCCCGTVSCCPFTSVNVSISLATLRFSNIDPNTGNVSNYQYRTQQSSVNSTLATLTLNSTIVKTHICTRSNVSPSSPSVSCGYRLFSPGYSGTGGWIAGTPWTGGILMIDTDPTQPFAQKWIANSHRWVVYAQPWSFNSGNPQGWEAGVRLELRDTAYTFAIPSIGGAPSVCIGATAAIVPSGCPTSLVYSFPNSDPQAVYRGRARTSPFEGSITATSNFGNVTAAGLPFVQYGLTPPSNINASVS